MGDDPPKAPLHARFGKISHVVQRPEPGASDGSRVPPATSGQDSTTAHGTASGGGPSSRAPHDRGSRKHRGGKGISKVDSVEDLYEVGKEVMPSTHSYMKVNFATRRADGQEVVVKVRFKPQCFRSREDERSWRHNTEFILNCPESGGVAKLHEVCEDPRAFYVVMEKVCGQDLFETLESDGRLSVLTVRAIVRQLLRSLSHLHSHNAVHKDLKLENVMLEPNPHKKGPSNAVGAIKVIDFDTLEEWTPSSPTSKDVVGTDQYIAPEAYAGRYSPLSDIFAVGVIAFRLLSGKFPFHDGMFDDKAGENWVGSPKMSQIRRRLKVTKIDFSGSVFREHLDACDLVTRMLAYSETHRPTAAAALEHAWFQEGDEVAHFCSPLPPRSESEELVDDGIIIAE